MYRYQGAVSVSASLYETDAASSRDARENTTEARKWCKWSIRKAVARAIEKLTVKLQMCLPHRGCSLFFGKIADCKIRIIKNGLIRFFAWMHGINFQELVKEHPGDYQNFNEFFTRNLKQGARVIAPPGRIASPVDGVVSQAGKIDEGKIIQAKGHLYSVKDLLGGDESLAELFRNGDFASLYLPPGAYHHFHMPMDGKLLKTIYIPGKLCSVSPRVVRHVDNIFARNERLVCIFDTPQGRMAMVMVGAINVSSIQTVWAKGIIEPQQKGGKRTEIHVTCFDDANNEHVYKKGDDLGAFRMGSTVICLFEKDRIDGLDELVSGERIKVGEAMGSMAEERAADDSESAPGNSPANQGDPEV